MALSLDKTIEIRLLKRTKASGPNRTKGKKTLTELSTLNEILSCLTQDCKVHETNLGFHSHWEIRKDFPKTGIENRMYTKIKDEVLEKRLAMAKGMDKPSTTATASSNDEFQDRRVFSLLHISVWDLRPAKPNSAAQTILKDINQVA